MRDLCSEDGKVDWDEPVPEKIASKFKQIIIGLGPVRTIAFPRSVVPSQPVKGPPLLLLFGDGSHQAYCAVAYLQWPLVDGGFACSLVACKVMVTPKKKLTIPRVEVMGALLATRLAKKVRDAFRFEIAGTRYFTDSSVVLGMLQCESVTFKEWLANRISEIKKNTKIEDWYWLPTHENLADLGTRPTVEARDLDSNSFFQKGRPWMLQPESSWPTRKTFSDPPREERNLHLVGVSATQVETGKYHFDLSQFLKKFSTLRRATRVFATCLLALNKWRSYRRIKVDPEVTPDPPEHQFISKRLLVMVGLNLRKPTCLVTRSKMVSRSRSLGCCGTRKQTL